MRGATRRHDATDENCTPSPVADGSGYHVYHGDSRSVAETVIDAVAAIRNLDPTETWIPVADCVDPDALDAIFDDTHSGTSRHGGHVVLSLLDLDVFVHANGHVFLRDTRTDTG
jgi:hypothetical protein